MPQSSIVKKAFLFLCACVCLIIFFNQLGERPIVMWDEATYANNAIDMYEHPNLLVVSTEGVAETYNSKPPLVIWMEGLSFKLFGLSEFSLRLPSALMGFFTVVILFWFCYKTLGNFTTGIFSALILITSKGYIYLHGVRTGDLDATLVFFTTLYTLSFFRMILLKDYSTKNIIIISFAIFFAFLSKGTAGLFLVPFLFFIALFTKDQRLIFADRRFYFAAATVAFSIIAYYLLREIVQPDYLKLVYKEEISRFGSDNYDWLEEPFDYYFQNFINGRFTPYIFFLPITFFTPLFTKDKVVRKLWLFTIITSVGYFLLISASKTKVAWYDLILYPLFALLISLFLVAVQEFVFSKIKNKWFLSHKNSITLSIVILLILPVYLNVFASTKFNEVPSGMYDMEREGAYMKILKNKFPSIKSYTVLKIVDNKKEHLDQIKFYQRIYKINFGYDIRIEDILDQKKDSIFLTCQKSFMDTIESVSGYHLIDSCEACKLYDLRSK